MARSIIKIAEAGDFDASTGAVSISENDLVGMVNGFEEAKSKGVLPALKYTHAQGKDSIGIGKITDIWIEDGWLKGRADILDDKYTDQINSGILEAVSLEADVGKTAYGETEYPFLLTSVALLPAGEFPAIGGAMIESLIASKSKDSIVVYLGKKDDKEKETTKTDTKEDVEKVSLTDVMEVLIKVVDNQNQLLEYIAYKDKPEKIVEKDIEKIEDDDQIEAKRLRVRNTDRIVANLRGQGTGRMRIKQSESDKYRRLLSTLDNKDADNVAQFLMNELPVIYPEREIMHSNSTARKTTMSAPCDELDQKVRLRMDTKHESYDVATSKVLESDIELRERYRKEMR